MYVPVMRVHDKGSEATGGEDEESHRGSARRFVFGACLWRDIFVRIVPAVGISRSGGLHRTRDRVISFEFLSWRLDREKTGAEQITKVDRDGLGGGSGVLFSDRENNKVSEWWLSEQGEFLFSRRSQTAQSLPNWRQES
jgi:hypothetical protein